MGHDGLRREGEHFAINYPLDILAAIALYNRGDKNEIGDGAVCRGSGSGITGFITIHVPTIVPHCSGYREIGDWHLCRSLHYCPDAVGLISGGRDTNGSKYVGNFPPLSFDVIVRSRQPHRHESSFWQQQHGAADPLAAVTALRDMGFPPDLSEKASTQTGGNLQRAIDIALQQRHTTSPPPEPSRYTAVGKYVVSALRPTPELSTTNKQHHNTFKHPVPKFKPQTKNPGPLNLNTPAFTTTEHRIR